MSHGFLATFQTLWRWIRYPPMRSKELLSIRPEISVNYPTVQSEAEQFQNNTLRPILKYQHTITLSLLQDERNFSKQFAQFQTQEQLQSGITSFMQSNKAFRYQILGCIIGMMTANEYEIYKGDTREYNKRIMTMQIQRYVDSIEV